jgi:hypothetical protein
MVRFVTLAGTLALMGCGHAGLDGFSLDVFASGSVQERPPGPLVPVPGVADETVEACRQAIAAAAAPYGATRVEAVSAGAVSQLPEGVMEAPIEARIVYEQSADAQVRQARVACRLDGEGGVVGLL